MLEAVIPPSSFLILITCISSLFFYIIFAISFINLSKEPIFVLVNFSVILFQSYYFSLLFLFSVFYFDLIFFFISNFLRWKHTSLSLYLSFMHTFKSLNFTQKTALDLSQNLTYYFILFKMDIHFKVICLCIKILPLKYIMFTKKRIKKLRNMYSNPNCKKYWIVKSQFKTYNTHI